MPVAFLLVLFVLSPGLALAQEGSPLTALAGSFHLLPRETRVAPIDITALDIASFDTSPPDRREPNHSLTALFSVGVIAGSAANSFHESPHQSFHFTNEGFFGLGRRYSCRIDDGDRRRDDVFRLLVRRPRHGHGGRHRRRHRRGDPHRGSHRLSSRVPAA
jgi:hypothetical protein